MNILFMCVANSARSQMAEGIARYTLPSSVNIASAGSQPSSVNPVALQAMQEIGIDISKHTSKSVADLPQEFVVQLDYVITLCAEEVCPVIISQAKKLHWPLPDPAHAENKEQSFREVREQLLDLIKSFKLKTANFPRISAISPELKIRSMKTGDWQQVADIYRMGIETQNATFETSVPTWEAWNDSRLQNCRFVAELNGEIVGWAALSKVSDRCVYSGVAEHSVYVHSNYFGKKIGEALLTRLIIDSELEGFWTLQSGIFPENVTSVRLHEKVGFRIVGKRERVGNLKGKWRDVLFMERRSLVVGSAVSLDPPLCKTFSFID